MHVLIAQPDALSGQFLYGSAHRESRLEQPIDSEWPPRRRVPPLAALMIPSDSTRTDAPPSTGQVQALIALRVHERRLTAEATWGVGDSVAHSRIRRNPYPRAFLADFARDSDRHHRALPQLDVVRANTCVDLTTSSCVVRRQP
jgi:hypothetical protein